VGKTFACHQLAERATGDLLLFVDADTVQSRTSIGAAVAELESTGAHLLTVIPRQSMVGFWEKILLPLLHFSTFCYLPMPLVSITRSPKLAMANGQFMLFRADAYRSIGGHASVRAALVEDVWLARRIKEHDRKLVIRYGGAEVSCRMYSSFRQIWDGFSKNLFPGFNYSLAMISGVVIFNGITSVVPFVAVAGGLVWGAIGSPWFLAAAIEGGLAILIRLLLAARFDMDRWPILLHPIAMVVFLGIAVNSVRCFVVGQGAQWKGRVYRAHDQVVSL
jgi:chlorobactene glucosyltransferase